MSLMAKQSEGLPAIKAATYQGVCYSVIDIGTHHNDFYDTDHRQVVITWEIPSLRIDIERDGHVVNLPRAISKTYTNSLSEKARLYADLVSWRGAEFTQEELDGFDLRKILGKNCILAIINKTNTKKKVVANVATVAHLMEGMKAQRPENPLVSFDMDEDGITNIPANIPDWIKKQIQESVEYKAVMHAQNNPALAAAQQDIDAMPEPMEDDIPF